MLAKAFKKLKKVKLKNIFNFESKNTTGRKKATAKN